MYGEGFTIYPESSYLDELQYMSSAKCDVTRMKGIARGIITTGPYFSKFQASIQPDSSSRDFFLISRIVNCVLWSINSTCFGTSWGFHFTGRVFNQHVLEKYWEMILEYIGFVCWDLI